MNMNYEDWLAATASRRCPHCDAQPGERCVSFAGTPYGWRFSHQVRHPQNKPSPAGRKRARVTERDLNIFEMRVVDGLTLNEIGNEVGLSGARISQIAARAETHLRGEGHRHGVAWVSVLSMFGEPGSAEAAAWAIFRKELTDGEPWADRRPRPAFEPRAFAPPPSPPSAPSAPSAPQRLPRSVKTMVIGASISINQVSLLSLAVRRKVDSGELGIGTHLMTVQLGSESRDVEVEVRCHGDLVASGTTSQ